MTHPTLTHCKISEAPVVDATRIYKQGRDVGELEIVCPFCGRLHYHGGGNGPGDGDGHRAAHCLHPDARCGYVLREVRRREGRTPSLDGGRPSTRTPISPAQRTRIMERDDFRCRRCGAGPRDERLVIDHVVPVALGGSSDDDNLQTLCEPCNQGKGARPPHPHDLEPR